MFFLLTFLFLFWAAVPHLKRHKSGHKSGHWISCSSNQKHQKRPQQGNRKSNLHLFQFTFFLNSFTNTHTHPSKSVRRNACTSHMSMGLKEKNWSKTKERREWRKCCRAFNFHSPLNCWTFSIVSLWIWIVHTHTDCPRAHISLHPTSSIKIDSFSAFSLVDSAHESNIELSIKRRIIDWFCNVVMVLADCRHAYCCRLVIIHT